MQRLREFLRLNSNHQQAYQQALAVHQVPQFIIRDGHEFTPEQLLILSMSPVLKEESVRNNPELLNFLLHVLQNSAIQPKTHSNQQQYDYVCDIATANSKKPVRVVTQCFPNGGILVRVDSKPLLGRFAFNNDGMVAMRVEISRNEDFEKIKGAFSKQETLMGVSAQTIRMRLAECGNNNASNLPLPDSLKNMVNSLDCVVDRKRSKGQSR